MSRQLTLALPHRAALGREDFLVAPSNRAAVALIDSWPNWPAHAVLMIGPAGSGKSHLVEVWRGRSGAPRIEAERVGAAGVPELLRQGSLAIEDLPGPSLDERGLFHLHNLARESGVQLLLTSASRPGSWDLALPDLVSRLRAAPVVELGPPDDELLRGVLVKHFADRQLAVDESLLSYLIARMPRSLDAARLLVSEIDRVALEERAEVTRPLASRILAGFASPGLFGED